MIAMKLFSIPQWRALRKWYHNDTKRLCDDGSSSADDIVACFVYVTTVCPFRTDVVRTDTANVYTYICVEFVFDLACCCDCCVQVSESAIFKQAQVRMICFPSSVCSVCIPMLTLRTILSCRGEVHGRRSLRFRRKGISNLLGVRSPR